MRAKEAIVALAPDSAAPMTRFRPACSLTALTARAIFFAVETLPIDEF